MEKKKDPFDLASGVPNIDSDLRPTPKFADRISVRIVGVVLLVIFLFLGIFFAALDAMDRRKEEQSAKSELNANKPKGKIDETVEGAPRDLKGDPDPSIGANPSAPTSAGPTSLVRQADYSDSSLDSDQKRGGAAKNKDKNVPALNKTGGEIPSDQTNTGRGGQTLTPEEQAANAAKVERDTRMAQARRTGLQVKIFSIGDPTKPDNPTGSNSGTGSGSDVAKILSAVNSASDRLQAANGPKDVEQDEKLDFLKKAEKETQGYHPHVPLAAISPNEVKFGTSLPMRLQDAINSDLPGLVTAKVTEDVYDTITGCRLLIPALSTVQGKYDSKVALGQGRNLVAWSMMYFPDGSELNLAGMQAYDTSGEAGLAADVDNHYLRLFGLTFAMSMITAEVQQSVPQPATTGAAPTPQQSIATALAQQYGQLGAQIIGKYMAVQPTLRNKAGEPFTIKVPRTMVFKKVWRKRC